MGPNIHGSLYESQRKGFSNIARTLLTFPDKLYDQQRMNNRKRKIKKPTYKEAITTFQWPAMFPDMNKIET
jgi:hypothetical protein